MRACSADSLCPGGVVVVGPHLSPLHPYRSSSSQAAPPVVVKEEEQQPLVPVQGQQQEEEAGQARKGSR